jgi:CheY-like chemotaxis protein
VPLSWSNWWQSKRYNFNLAHLNTLPALYIDDAASNLFLVELIAEAEGIMLETAATGEEGIKKINSKTYSMILSDIRLPDINGYEILKQIRISSNNAYTPVVAFTADVTLTTREKIVEHGFTDYLTKPFREEDLIRKFSVYRNRSEEVPDFSQYSSFIKEESQLAKARKMVIVDFQDFEKRFSQAWVSKNEKDLQDQLHKIDFVCQSLKLTLLAASLQDFKIQKGYGAERELLVMKIRRDLLSLYSHLG